MSAFDTSQQIRPKKIWWLIGVIMLMGCVLVQMPALWLVQQLAPNSPYLQQVAGNVWQGSAVVQLPVATGLANQTPLSGAVAWQWRPLALLLGKAAADVDISSGQTHLQGRVSRGLKQWQLKNLTGKIDKQTLAAVVDWQLPDAPIQINALNVSLHEETGFSKVDGQLTWAGGELGYPSAGKVYAIVLPAMRADVSQESRQGAEVLHLNLVDNNSKRLGDLYLDNSGMLDVNLTQRLLENMPTYKGSAPADTAVVSVRQPLFKGGLFKDKPVGAGQDGSSNNATVPEAAVSKQASDSQTPTGGD